MNLAYICNAELSPGLQQELRHTWEITWHINADVSEIAAFVLGNCDIAKNDSHHFSRW